MPSYTKAFFFNSITFCAESDTPLCQSSGNGAKTRRIEDFQPDFYRIGIQKFPDPAGDHFLAGSAILGVFLLRIFSRIDLAG